MEPVVFYETAGRRCHGNDTLMLRHDENEILEQSSGTNRKECGQVLWATFVSASLSTFAPKFNALSPRYGPVKHIRRMQSAYVRCRRKRLKTDR